MYTSKFSHFSTHIQNIFKLAKTKMFMPISFNNSSSALNEGLNFFSLHKFLVTGKKYQLPFLPKV